MTVPLQNGRSKMQRAYLYAISRYVGMKRCVRFGGKVLGRASLLAPGMVLVLGFSGQHLPISMRRIRVHVLLGTPAVVYISFAINQLEWRHTRAVYNGNRP